MSNQDPTNCGTNQTYGFCPVCNPDGLSIQKIDAAAQKAYHAYGAVTDHKNYQGLPMPTWDALPPKIQDAWRAAAESLMTKVEG